ncbi:ATP-dependent DNA ligase LigA [Natronobacterium gregoryi]|uniref:DNA ligase n=2 Tax=Natronobacterium gregoryi TaxID=44930 RepID=L0AEL7_NATGS|nr:ATP-dependent DNA ligase LigA [Natronobacterium gregoryi]AFZ71577.1 ATP-dependent DNA ligase I [Natronobacterium gregoryi SP2]ELY66634.1 DNA ligase [Natronobacterium gregoryi SP2]PLK21346.1 DNA ligase [Natronobacterium gregoryi SP2]SFI81309.1 DNA ligase-1 [Natronobacterium gregoryi]
MEFATFADRAAAIEAEPADLAIIEHVQDLLADTDGDAESGEPRTIEIVARFVQGRVFPAWDSTTLDIGPSACYEAISRAAGRNVDTNDVEDRLADVGEIGEVAASYEFGGQQGLDAFGAGNGSGALTVREVYDDLVALAAAEGEGSEDRKIDALFGLFNRCSSDEARYLARLVLSEMRIGVGEGTVRDAIAAAFDIPQEHVERALQVSNDYGEVARVARDEGLDGLDAMALEVGRPVQAMLAQTGTVTDALEAWEEAAVEWKYDGARIQLHYDPDGLEEGDGTTRVFSRNMEDVTAALPEVVEFAEKTLAVPVILDGEVVAVDDAGDPLPFQEVLKRFRRKHDVAKAREDVAVRPVCFDCLHADGVDLLEEPLTTRHERLEVVLTGDGRPEDVAGLSLLWLTDDPDEIESIDAEALESGHEGIMLKNPESAYSPGRRGKNWRKRKPDVETLDCVVTGAEWGEGRRATFLGTFELSVRNETTGELETVGKVATGITDEQLAELTELLEPHIATEEGQEVEIEPAVVFEVGYEEIQSSPTYSSGYALRFPRFQAVRDDKAIEGADTLERVERLRS